MAAKKDGGVVYCQRWVESERGWGVRPDGCSIHRTLADLKKFVEAYWKDMPVDAPDEYSRPEGEPIQVNVTESVYKPLRRKGSQRYWAGTYSIDGARNFKKVR